VKKSLIAMTPPAGAAPNPFVNFESGHVRPLALSADGSRLFAVNTPDNRLAIFAVTATGLALQAEVPVALEPVAVAVRQTTSGTTEVWVVNHLCDSVSIVTVDDGNRSNHRCPRVRRSRGRATRPGVPRGRRRPTRAPA
jgi:DNA-binding beta-propeller fold protein YncE